MRVLHGHGSYTTDMLTGATGKDSEYLRELHDLSRVSGVYLFLFFPLSLSLQIIVFI